MYLDDIAQTYAYSAPAAEVASEASSIRVTRQTPEASEAGELSVLTYNVRGLPWPLALNRAKALREIGRELAAMRQAGRQPDLVLIQEGFREEVADLVRESGYAYWARGPGRPLAKLTNGGLHILSDAPILDVRRAAFGACAGFDCLANKGAMMVRVQPVWSPTPIDVVNTHMNARKASGAPRSQTLPAHHGQTRELTAFVTTHRDTDHPLLVGGDFNIRNSQARYDYQADTRPFAVVEEFCSRSGSGCGAGAPDTTTKPWLRTQDLQGFRDGVVRVQPVASRFLFDQGEQRLSDHEAYLVRYRLSWKTETLAAVYQPDPSLQVKPHKLGFRVSWAP